MYRRHLLATLALAPLAACSGTTPSQVAQDATLIAQGLANLLPTLKAIPGVKIAPTDEAAISAELTVIQQLADQIGAVATPGASLLQQLDDGVGILAGLVAPFYPAAPLIATAIQAALTLAASLVGKASAAPGRMTVDEARAKLRAMR